MPSLVEHLEGPGHPAPHGAEGGHLFHQLRHGQGGLVHAHAAALPPAQRPGLRRRAARGGQGRLRRAARAAPRSAQLRHGGLQPRHGARPGHDLLLHRPADHARVHGVLPPRRPGLQVALPVRLHRGVHLRRRHMVRHVQRLHGGAPPRHALARGLRRQLVRLRQPRVRGDVGACLGGRRHPEDLPRLLCSALAVHLPRGRTGDGRRVQACRLAVAQGRLLYRPGH
mmetsp:Transcript_41413/g.128735  ORF Transcript_41413/g.128735 Transcript_41413/m.128735 type:complete len:226 (+) Transcript_41413:187-864(+)